MKQRATLSIPLLIAVAMALVPRAADAQVTIGGRAGTLGLGAELVVITNEVVSLRAGAGFAGFDADVTSLFRLEDNRQGSLAVPKSMYTLGLDFAVGNFRIGGGVLYKERNPVYALNLGDGARIDIGGSTYTQPEVTSLTTTLVSREWAPYALVGLGQPVARGLGLFLDVGVAFLGDSDLAMSATGQGRVVASRRFRRDLDTERQNVRNDAGDLVKYWPILSMGVQFGFGEGKRRRGERW
ncbi:MAG: hypothetical protein F4187_00375 [Gemmatimonadetes bacterium]|nr:hypothetical protein [Gemmatimonadota bacterium]MYI07138.1 hypothetical protein [Gemmatimonadota bacterium]